MNSAFVITKNGNVTTLSSPDKNIHLIGTAHVSKESVDEVNQFIQTHKPDTVCIELCQTRYDTMRDKDRWKKMDIYNVIKTGKAFLLLTNLMISSFQYRIGKELGVKPGAEMFAAIESAEKIGSKMVLIDRDVQVTLKRTWRNISFFKKISLLFSLMLGLVLKEEIKKEDIEKLKSSDALADAMSSLGHEIPGLKESLIDERDRYMASHLTELEGKNIVAVVGAGHVAGMQNYIGQTIDREPLKVVPPSSKIWKVIKWVIPILLLGIIIFYFNRSTSEGSTFLFVWAITHCFPAALGVMIAGGKIVTAITAFLIAPFTPIIPVLRISIITGLVETILRKPKVEDLEHLPDAFDSIKSFYHNSVTRILLVASMASILNNLGTWIFTPYLMAFHEEACQNLLEKIINFF